MKFARESRDDSRHECACVRQNVAARIMSVTCKLRHEAGLTCALDTAYHDMKLAVSQGHCKSLSVHQSIFNPRNCLISWIVKDQKSCPSGRALKGLLVTPKVKLARMWSRFRWLMCSLVRELVATALESVASYTETPCLHCMRQFESHAIVMIIGKRSACIAWTGKGTMYSQEADALLSHILQNSADE